MNRRNTSSAPSLTGYLNFFWAGLVKREQTGALVPSQRFLIAKMLAPIPETYDGRLIELGAGTGALTIQLALKCPAAQILACEINPVLARHNRINLGTAGLNGRVQVVSDAAERVLAAMRSGAVPKADFVLSGIPLGNFGGERVRALLQQIYDALRPGGLYIQFQHSLLDRKKIRTQFSNIRTVPVLLNFPPAFVYYARKPTTCAAATCDQ